MINAYNEATYIKRMEMSAMSVFGEQHKHIPAELHELWGNLYLSYPVLEMMAWAERKCHRRWASLPPIVKRLEAKQGISVLEIAMESLAHGVLRFEGVMPEFLLGEYSKPELDTPFFSRTVEMSNWHFIWTVINKPLPEGTDLASDTLFDNGETDYVTAIIRERNFHVTRTYIPSSDDWLVNLDNNRNGNDASPEEVLDAIKLVASEHYDWRRVCRILYVEEAVFCYHMKLQMQIFGEGATEDLPDWAIPSAEELESVTLSLVCV